MPRTRLALILLPPLVLVTLIVWFSVDVPFNDEWEFAFLMEKARLHTLTAGDLFAAANEHRVLVPRLLALGLASLSDWDIRWELGVNVVCAVGMYLGIASQLGRRSWAAVVASVLVFSLSQKENWFFGLANPIVLNVASAAGALLILSREKLDWRGWLAASLLALVSSYSFANGNLVWFIGATVLIVRHRAQWPLLAGWALVSLAALVPYVAGYSTPTGHPSLGFVVHHPLHAAAYVLLYLGSPIAGYLDATAGIAGALGLGLFGWLAVHHYRRADLPVAPLAIAAYAIGSALLTTLARAGFGIHQALESRYNSMSTLLWLAVLMLLTTEWRALPRRPALAVGAVLLGSLLVHDWKSAGFGIMDCRERAEARAELLAGNDRLFARLFPWREPFLERLAIVRRYHLSLFRADGGQRQQ